MAIHRIELGHPSLLEFRGPDAIRFLNGQVTQDVRQVVGTAISLPSCVTDAKGRLQFRVDLTSGPDDGLWVAGLQEWAEALEARLTRYLIADDVEVANLTGSYGLTHFTGRVGDPPDGVLARASNRYASDGTDWWIPKGMNPVMPDEVPLLEGDELEAMRISLGLPVWGRELLEGMLPPEAGLDQSDISYQKGCYIGQEVISRIKSAGKVNKKLARWVIASEEPVSAGPLVDANGSPSGELTSVSPRAAAGGRLALGFVKRGATEFFIKREEGVALVVSLA